MIPHFPTPSYLSKGPWDHEPDGKVWSTGALRCCVMRMPAGHLCGYVGVPTGHHLFGKGASDKVFYDGRMQELSEVLGGRFGLSFYRIGLDGYHWFGFAADMFRPAEVSNDDPENYIPFEAVREEVLNLAETVKSIPDMTGAIESLKQIADGLAGPEGIFFRYLLESAR